MVHGAGFHPDENLVFPELRIGNIFVAENFRAAKFMEANGFHTLTSEQAHQSIWHSRSETSLPFGIDLTKPAATALYIDSRRSSFELFDFGHRQIQ
jgi:hypothetical protein